MEIEGQRVLLRPQQDSDADFFFKWYNEPDIMKKCGFVNPTTMEARLASIHNEREDRLWFTVVEKATGKILGETGLLRMWPWWKTTDLTIILPNPAAQRKGYGKETIRLMFDLAFRRLGYNRIAIGVVGFNHAALQFYESVGFKREGIQEQGYLCDGVFSDFVMMRILYDEYVHEIGDADGQNI